MVDYVEFPVDPLVGVHWAKKKDDGGGGDEPVVCGSETQSIQGGISLGDPIWYYFGGAPLPEDVIVSESWTVTITYTADVVPFLPPYTWPRPGYTFQGVMLQLAFSNDGGASVEIVVSEGGDDLPEGSSITLTASYERPFSPPRGAVGFAATASGMTSQMPWWFPGGGAAEGTGTATYTAYCVPTWPGLDHG